MAAKTKTKINDHGDVIFTEQEAIDLLYTNPDFDISKLFFEHTEQYNDAIKQIGADLTPIKNKQKLATLEPLPTPHTMLFARSVSTK